MRISDWSSDVCSSDLDALLQGAGGQSTTARRHGACSRRPERNVPRLTPARAWTPAPGLRPTGRCRRGGRSEEHTSELQSLMRISYSVFCLTKKDVFNISIHTAATYLLHIVY